MLVVYVACAAIGATIGRVIGLAMFTDRKGTAVSDLEYLRQLELEVGVERVEGYDRKRHEQLRFKIQNSPGLWGEEAEELEQLEEQWRTLRAFPPDSWWK